LGLNVIQIADGGGPLTVGNIASRMASRLRLKQFFDLGNIFFDRPQRLLRSHSDKPFYLGLHGREYRRCQWATNSATGHDHR
jgi:hypothetical protein